MRWKAEDMEKISAMETYIDTLLYPVCVLPASWDRGWISGPFWLERICAAAEQQLTGRVFMFQPLPVASKSNYLHTTVPYIMQNLEAMQARFPFSLVVTNEQELADRVRDNGWEAAVISPVPDLTPGSKPFLEKAQREGNEMVQQLIESWKKSVR